MAFDIGTLGVALALSGAALTAIPSPRVARYGFCAYVAADAPLFAYALSLGESKLALMYAGFIICASVGVYLRSNHGGKLYATLCSKLPPGWRDSRARPAGHHN
jgi:hypothetical protein